MNKIAQRRGVLNKLREMTNVSGIAAEKFFSPQFEEVMDNLRSIDSNVRSIVAGRQLEGGDPGNISTSLKDLIASAKSNLNRREFMTAIAELGRFHSKIKEVLGEIGKLHNKVDQIHHQYLFQDLDEEHKKELGDLPQRWATANEYVFIKEALGESITDFLHNTLTDRGRALNFYEKRYSRDVGALKKAIGKMIIRSQAMLSMILVSLKDMASARATRNPDKYIKSAGAIEKGYATYDGAFKEFYNNNVKKYEKHFTPNKPEAMGPASVGEPPTQPSPGPAAVVPSGSDPATVQPTGSTVPAPGATAVPTGEPVAPVRAPGAPLSQDLMQYLDEAQRIQNTAPTTPSPAVSQSGVQAVEPAKPGTMIGVAPEANPRGTAPYGAQAGQALPPMLSHGKFFQSLQAMSGEHPAILSSFIKKYAQGIQKSDPTTAVQLLQIAKSIRG